LLIYVFLSNFAEILKLETWRSQTEPWNLALPTWNLKLGFANLKLLQTIT